MKNKNVLKIPLIGPLIEQETLINPFKTAN